MSNPIQWVLVRRFGEVAGYSENVLHRKDKNGTWLCASLMMFELRESRELHQQSGAV